MMVTTTNKPRGSSKQLKPCLILTSQSFDLNSVEQFMYGNVQRPSVEGVAYNA